MEFPLQVTADTHTRLSIHTLSSFANLEYVKAGLHQVFSCWRKNLFLGARGDFNENSSISFVRCELQRLRRRTVRRLITRITLNRKQLRHEPKKR